MAVIRRVLFSFSLSLVVHDQIRIRTTNKKNSANHVIVTMIIVHDEQSSFFFSRDLHREQETLDDNSRERDQPALVHRQTMTI